MRALFKASPIVLLGLLFLLSKGGGSSSPRSFPATPPGGPTGDGRDWFAIYDGDHDWGVSKLETLSSANARWRAVKESSPGTQLFRYSFPFKKWLKVA